MSLCIENQEMRMEKNMIFLVIPPVSDCFMPTLGVTQIAGFLKEKKVNCRVFDANAELTYNIFNMINQLSDNAKWIIWNDGEYSHRNVVAAMNFYSACNEQFSIYPDDFKTDFYWRDLDKTLEFANSYTSFHRKMEELSFMKELKLQDEIVYCGFSISYESQVIPTMILAKIVKEKYSKVKICIGGSLLYNYEDEFYKLLYLSDLIDVLVLGAGELVYYYLENDDILKLEKLLGINVVKVGKKFIIDTRNMNSHPIVYAPDFSDINFEYYPIKAKAFPYMIKDKCYYGQCHFCNGDKVLQQNNEKQVERAFEQIEKISSKMKIDNVYLVDAALSPIDMKTIGSMNLKHEVHWIANARFEKQLIDEIIIKHLAKNGCTMLRFGLESGSQKILNLMNKGTNVEIAESVLQLTTKHGIKNHVYIMFGYPGESELERKETLDFLERNKKYIHSYSVSVFQPIPGTKIYENLSEKNVDKDNEYDSIIKSIYSDENDYRKLCGDIMQIDFILKDYAQTNLAFYSANIFNKLIDNNTSINKRKIVIDRKVLEQELEGYVHLHNNLYVIECGQEGREFKYVHADFYRNVMIHFNVSDNIVEKYKKQCETDILNDVSLQEFIDILDNYSQNRSYEHYKVSKFENDISQKMSIQFAP